jgi:hypothetical protein
VKQRKPSITQRLADQCDRMAFGMEALLNAVPRESDLDPAAPKPLAPSVDRMTAEARALVAEYRSGGRRP